MASAAGGLASTLLGGSLGKVITNGFSSVGKFISGAVNAGASALGLIKDRATDARDLWGTGQNLYNRTSTMMAAAKSGGLTNDSVRTYVGEVEQAAAKGMQTYQRTQQSAEQMRQLYQGVRADYRNVVNVRSGQITRPDPYSGQTTVYNPMYQGRQVSAPQAYDPYRG